MAIVWVVSENLFWFVSQLIQTRHVKRLQFLNVIFFLKKVKRLQGNWSFILRMIRKLILILMNKNFNCSCIFDKNSCTNVWICTDSTTIDFYNGSNLVISIYRFRKNDSLNWRWRLFYFQFLKVLVDILIKKIKAQETIKSKFTKPIETFSFITLLDRERNEWTWGLTSLEVRDSGFNILFKKVINQISLLMMIRRNMFIGWKQKTLEMRPRKMLISN